MMVIENETKEPARVVGATIGLSVESNKEGHPDS
jgi:hypothetical protein